MTNFIHHGNFSRSQYDMNEWYNPIKYGSNTTTLDLFDSFDELDTTIGKNYYWITKPEFTQQYQGVRVPQKYRIMIDCAGYGPKSIKTEFVGRKLFVIGHEEHRISNDDFYSKEFKKPFDLPATAEIDKYSSFMTTTGHFVVEFPLKETSTQPNTELIPKLFDMTSGSGNGKGIQMKFSLPDNCDPAKVFCYIKDRDFIVKTEDKTQKYDAYVKFYYYKRSSLPENTDFDQLKCYFENNKIVLSAPIRTDYKGGQFRSVPMEYCTKKH